MNINFNLHIPEGEHISTPYLKIVGVLYGLTGQQLRVLSEMVKTNKHDPSADRKSTAKAAGIRNIESYNNVFVALKKKGAIVPGSNTRYAYAPGIVPPDGTTSLTFNFLDKNAGTEEGNNS